MKNEKLKYKSGNINFKNEENKSYVFCFENPIYAHKSLNPTLSLVYKRVTRGGNNEPHNRRDRFNVYISF